jgi:hypothetical protein
MKISQIIAVFYREFCQYSKPIQLKKLRTYTTYNKKKDFFNALNAEKYAWKTLTN